MHNNICYPQILKQLKDLTNPKPSCKDGSCQDDSSLKDQNAPIGIESQQLRDLSIGYGAHLRKTYDPVIAGYTMSPNNQFITKMQFLGKDFKTPEELIFSGKLTLGIGGAGITTGAGLLIGGGGLVASGPIGWGLVALGLVGLQVGYLKCKEGREYKSDSEEYALPTFSRNQKPKKEFNYNRSTLGYKKLTDELKVYIVQDLLRIMCNSEDVKDLGLKLRDIQSKITEHNRSSRLLSVKKNQKPIEAIESYANKLISLFNRRPKYALAFMEKLHTTSSNLKIYNSLAKLEEQYTDYITSKNKKRKFLAIGSHNNDTVSELLRELDSFGEPQTKNLFKFRRKPKALKTTESKALRNQAAGRKR